jgi:hypothetical protein
MAPKKASAKAAAKQGAKKSARPSKKASPKKAPKVEKSIAKLPKAKATPKSVTKSPKSAKSPKGASPKATPKSVAKSPAPKSAAKSPRAGQKSPKRATVEPLTTKGIMAPRAKSPVTKPAAKAVTWAKSPKSTPVLTEGERLLATKATAHEVHKQVKLEKYQAKVLELRRAGAWALFPADSAKPPLVVKPQRTVTVGRHRDSMLHLDDRRISVFHAELRLLYLTSAQRAAQAPGLYLRSLSENNPAIVRGVKIRGGWAQLYAGEDVEFVPGIRYTVAGPEAPPKAKQPLQGEVEVVVAPPEKGLAEEHPFHSDDEDEEEEWASEGGVCCFCFADDHRADCCPHAAAAVKSARIENARFYQGMRGPKRTGDRFTEKSWI